MKKTLLYLILVLALYYPVAWFFDSLRIDVPEGPVPAAPSPAEKVVAPADSAQLLSAGNQNGEGSVIRASSGPAVEE